MQRCPRGCRPANPLAGYIDNPAALQEGPRAIWLAPNGDDTAYPGDSHAEAAHAIIKRNKFTGCGHVVRCLLALGWIRVHLRWQSMNVELSRALTSAQRATLQRYIHMGAQIESAAFTPLDGNDRNSRYILADGVRSLTVQQLQHLAPSPSPVPPRRRGLTGYIDEPQASIQGRQSIWIAPDGSDLDSSRDTHGWVAAVILGKKRPERPEVGYNAILELMTQGWIRMHLAHGSMHLHMATVPTPAQVETLRKYEATGATASTLEAGTDEYASKLWHDDGITRMTAGRIAAWARQALEPTTAVGGVNDWRTEGYEVTHDLTQDGTHVWVLAELNGQIVGELEAGRSAAEPGFIYPVMVKVNDPHRRKGLATAMYQRAEQVLGMKFKRGGYQSPEAKALWAQKNRPFGAP